MKFFQNNSNTQEDKVKLSLEINKNIFTKLLKKIRAENTTKEEAEAAKKEYQDLFDKTLEQRLTLAQQNDELSCETLIEELFKNPRANIYEGIENLAKQGNCYALFAKARLFLTGSVALNIEPDFKAVVELCELIKNSDSPLSASAAVKIANSYKDNFKNEFKLFYKFITSKYPELENDEASIDSEIRNKLLTWFDGLIEIGCAEAANFMGKEYRTEDSQLRVEENEEKSNHYSVLERSTQEQNNKRQFQWLEIAINKAIKSNQLKVAASIALDYLYKIKSILIELQSKAQQSDDYTGIVKKPELYTSIKTVLEQHKQDLDIAFVLAKYMFIADEEELAVTLLKEIVAKNTYLSGEAASAIIHYLLNKKTVTAEDEQLIAEYAKVCIEYKESSGLHTLALHTLGGHFYSDEPLLKADQYMLYAFNFTQSKIALCHNFMGIITAGAERFWTPGIVSHYFKWATKAAAVGDLDSAKMFYNMFNLGILKNAIGYTWPRSFYKKDDFLDSYTSGNKNALVLKNVELAEEWEKIAQLIIDFIAQGNEYDSKDKCFISDEASLEIQQILKDNGIEKLIKETTNFIDRQLYPKLERAHIDVLDTFIGTEGFYRKVLEDSDLDVGTLILYLDRAINLSCSEFLEYLDKLHKPSTRGIEKQNNEDLIHALKFINDLLRNNMVKFGEHGCRKATVHYFSNIASIDHDLLSKKIIELIQNLGNKLVKNMTKEDLDKQKNSRLALESTIKSSPVWRTLFDLPSEQLPKDTELNLVDIQQVKDNLTILSIPHKYLVGFGPMTSEHIKALRYLVKKLAPAQAIGEIYALEEHELEWICAGLPRRVIEQIQNINHGHFMAAAMKAGIEIEYQHIKNKSWLTADHFPMFDKLIVEKNLTAMKALNQIEGLTPEQAPEDILASAFKLFRI